MEKKRTNSAPSMKIAAVIQLGSKYISIIVQLLVTAVLARLISPEDFGVLAIVTVFVALFSMLSDMGVSVAIVQFRDLSETDYGRLFAFSIVLSIALTIGFCASSPLIAAIYGNGELIPLCCSASLNLLFATLNMVPNGIMLKQKDFYSIGVRLIVATVVSGGIAIALASVGFGAYALVAQMVSSSAVVFFWNYIKRPIRSIDFHFMSSLRKIMGYSAYQFGFGVVNYFSRNLDNLLLGKFLGAEALGYYDKAYKLAVYPLTAFSGVVNSIIQPYMAEHQDDFEAIFRYWLRITRLFSLIAMPISVVFFICSEELVLVLYGEQWIPSVPLFKVLSLSIYFQMTANSCGAFYQSIGHTDLLFKNALVNTGITVLFLTIGLSLGSTFTVAVGITAAYMIHWIPICYFLVVHGFEKSPRCLSILVPDVVWGIALILINGTIGGFFHYSPLINLALKCITAVTLTLVLYIATGRFMTLKNEIVKSA